MIFILFIAVAICFNIEKYETESDGMFHTNDLLALQNEGGNTELCLDEHKMVYFEFDFSQDFLSHEVMNAVLQVHAKDTFGEGKLEACWLSEVPIEGLGSYFNREVSERIEDDGTGASFSANGAVEWDLFDSLDCSFHSRVNIPNMHKGLLEIDIKDMLVEMAEYSVEDYKTLGRGFLVLKKKSMHGADLRTCFFSKEGSALKAPVVNVELQAKAELYGFHKKPFEWRVYMSDENLAVLDNNPAAEEYVRCNVEYDNFLHTDSGCRYKGGDSTLLSCLIHNPDGTFGGLNTEKCRKLSFKISAYKFRGDEYPASEEKRKLYGQKKINLIGLEAVMHNTADNIGYDNMQVALGMHMYNMAGVLTERYRYAKLWVNDDYFGLYLMIEQVDDVYTEDRFASDDEGGEGQLWKEIWWNIPSDPNQKWAYFDDHYEEGSEDFTYIIGIADQINAIDVNAETSKAFMNDNFDMSAILTTMAVTTLTGNFDSIQYQKCVKYFNPGDTDNIPQCASTDYSVSNALTYRRIVNGVSKLVIIPRDFDNVAIGDEYFSLDNWYVDQDAETCANGKVSYYSSVQGIIMRHMPAQCDNFFKMVKIHFWEEYVERFNIIAETIATEENIEDWIDMYSKIVRKELSREPSGIPSTSEWYAAVDGLEARMNAKIAQAVQELAVELESLEP